MATFPVITEIIASKNWFVNLHDAVVTDMINGFIAQGKTNGVRHLEYHSADLKCQYNPLESNFHHWEVAKLTRFWNSKESAQDYLDRINQMGRVISTQITDMSRP